MSVVNKMLQDLEQRQETEGSDAVYQPPVKKSSRVLVYSLLGLLVVVYALWWFLSAPASQNATKAPAVLVDMSESATTPKPSAKPMQVVSTAQTLPEVVPPALDQAQPADNIDVEPNNTPPLSAHVNEPPVVSSNPTKSVAPQESSFAVSSSQPAPTSGQRLQMQISAALETGDKPRAMELLIRLLREQPDHSAARQQLATIYADNGRLDMASNLLRDGIRLAPEDTDVVLMLARLLLNQQANEQALKLLNEHQAKPSRLVEFHSLKAGIAQGLKKWSQVQQAYQQLVVVQPDNARWWLGLGIAAEQTEQTLLASRAYQKAMSLNQLDNAVLSFIQQRLNVLGGQ